MKARNAMRRGNRKRSRRTEPYVLTGPVHNIGKELASKLSRRDTQRLRDAAILDVLGDYDGAAMDIVGKGIRDKIILPGEPQ